MALDTIDRTEFDHRLDTANERLRQELGEAQERVRRLDNLLRQKEAFAQKLGKMLSDIERDEAEIAAAEKELRLRGNSRRRRSPSPPVSA